MSSGKEPDIPIQRMRRAGAEATGVEAPDPLIEVLENGPLRRWEEGTWGLETGRLFPLKIRVRRWFNLFFIRQKVKNRKHPTRQEFLTHQNHHTGF